MSLQLLQVLQLVLLVLRRGQAVQHCFVALVLGLPVLVLLLVHWLASQRCCGSSAPEVVHQQWLPQERSWNVLHLEARASQQVQAVQHCPLAAESVEARKDAR